MSQTEVRALLIIAILLPFPFALLIAFTGGAPKLRGMLSTLFALSTAIVNLALLNGFLAGTLEPTWGSFRLTRFTFPLFLVLNLVCAAAVLYAGFRKTETPRPGLLTATIPAASGLAALAILSRGLVAQVALWEGVTACALVGLAAAGGGDLRKRLTSFTPWLLADALFIAGVVLCKVWLDETAVFIAPPLTSGSEMQVVIVAALFLAAALLRLGAFPFHFWIRELLERTDAAWSAFFIGAVNFLLAGMRLVVTVVFLARLVAGNWGLGLIIAGLVSILAGPLAALRRPTVGGYLAGMYALQTGFLIVGLGLFSRSGLEGAMFCLLVSPLFITAAIMAAGTTEAMRGTGRLHQRSLSARLAPAAFVALLVSGMSLAGLPPLDGFVGKALVALADFDKAAAGSFYALAAGLTLAAIGLAAVCVVRTVGGVFAPTGPEVPALRQKPAAEGIAALGLCAASLMLGMFPDLLLENFIARGSRLIFPSGFTGPGIAFRGTGEAVDRALGLYSGWASNVAAFLLAVSVIILAVYFASRAAHASDGPADRFEPFIAGASGEYHDSLASMRPWPRIRTRGR